MESSPPRTSTEVPNVAGKKRPASLLPAFDPSSSPPLPRPLKRVARESEVDISTYPTPVPTSSTAILSSSPPRVQNARSDFRRTHPMVSERAPLSAVASIMLSESGETITMGRSSASCDYQLSANRLISRTHVQATYKPATTPFGRDRIEILCSGWNGIKLHCQGKTYELTKGKTFTSDIRDADVMIDVQDARVLVQWPRPERKDSATNSDHTWDENSPTKVQQIASRRHSTNSSPLRSRRPVSPVSPSPAVQSLTPSGNPLLTPSRSSQAAVVVYEDEPSPTREQRPDDPSVSQVTQLASNPMNDSLANSMSSSFSKAEELSEHDEENDPVVHSFNENALSSIPSFRAGGSLASSRIKSSKATTSPKQTGVPEVKGDKSGKEQVQNHVANQLAFSRLSSTPLSTILSNLPPTLWKKKSSSTSSGFTSSEIRTIIEGTPCIGVVSREGKDAAGKPLESEYYYVPDFDEDTMRKEAVVHDLRKPGLRNCRKQHKQYFWRKPK